MSSILDADCIECATDDMVSNSWQVFHPSPPNEDDGVFLEVMPDSRNIGSHFDPIGQSHTGNFSKGRIGFLGSVGIDSNTDASFLGRPYKSRSRSLAFCLTSSNSNQLINRWHLDPL